MESVLKEKLGCSAVTRCGGAYIVDGKKMFVKHSSTPDSRQLVEGEFKSLEEISATNTVRTPEPIKYFEMEGTSYLVTEYLDMSSLNKFAAELGQNMANLHLYNHNLHIESKKNDGFVGKNTEYVKNFGFPVATCCGVIPMKNEWNDNWLQFFARNRLKHQLDLVESNYRDLEARNLWPTVERNLSKFFSAEMEIKPSLLHGDLWGGNAGELENKPCIYDPSAFYGHSEYDLAISHMFGGFPSAFFVAYHKIIPKKPGFQERQKLYQLFHYLNHWNHFGGGYRSSSISLMREIANF